MTAAVAFEKEELEALARTFRKGRWVDARDRALLALGCSCPARVSEMLALRESGVADPQGRVAGVWHCAAKDNKTRTATDYEITPTAREALEAWLPMRRRLGYRRCDPLFPALGRTGAMSRWSAWGMIKRRCAEAGVELRGHSCHSMKKTAIGNAYDSLLERLAAGEKGIDPLRDAQAFSGHKSLSQMIVYLRKRADKARREGFAAADKGARPLLEGWAIDGGKDG